MINVIVILLILVSTMVGAHFCNTVFELIVVFVLGVLSGLVYTLCVLLSELRIRLGRKEFFPMKMGFLNKRQPLNFSVSALTGKELNVKEKLRYDRKN